MKIRLWLFVQPAIAFKAGKVTDRSCLYFNLIILLT